MEEAAINALIDRKLTEERQREQTRQRLDDEKGDMRSYMRAIAETPRTLPPTVSEPIKVVESALPLQTIAFNDPPTTPAPPVAPNAGGTLKTVELCTEEDGLIMVQILTFPVP